MIDIILKNIINIPGWKTNRKIVVIESDDWGSIRMPSTEVFRRLQKADIPVDSNHYNLYDCLESDEDIEYLFNVLLQFKDATGRHPVMTGVNVVANPDFTRIKEADYEEYFYEPYTETLKRYPKHDRVYSLWKEGLEKRLFVPTFHGREHLNVQRWLRALQTGNRSVKIAFENGVTGIPRKGINGELVPGLQAAFDIDTTDDLPYLKDVLQTGLDLFYNLYGYRSQYFVPTNGPFNNSLEKILFQEGVKYINSAKRQMEPIGNNQYKSNIRFLGEKNRYGQIYLTRNCFFEPSSIRHSSSKDCVDSCLKEISIAFKWNKPAIISSHRVNYIGFLHPKNRESSLRLLRELLRMILKNWSDVEFMTSVELGGLIVNTDDKVI